MLISIIPEAWHALIALGVVILMFAAFIRESYPVEVIALSGASFLLFSGLLSYDSALAVFSNSAPWTIAAMFILSGALVRTGVLAQLTDAVIFFGERYPIRVLIALGIFIIIASAFMNNTPVVVIMIPVTVQIASVFGISVSKLLIPLSYMAIVGGMCTLIGTSTNLLVDGVARAAGLEPFGIFEITPLAFILVLFGAIYLWLIGIKLLPSRASISDILSKKKRKRFFTEVVIPQDSALIGKLVENVDLLKHETNRVIDVIRGDHSLRRELKSVKLQAGDIVILNTAVTDLLFLTNSKEIILANQISSRETVIIESLVSPECHLIGRSLGSARLRRRFGVYPVALHRRNQNINSQLDNIVIKIGDTLLVEGNVKDIQRMTVELNMVALLHPTLRSYRRKHAPVVIGSLMAVVGFSAFGLLPIFVVAALAVSVVLLIRSIDAEEAFEAVDGRLLVLIFSMLAVGAALQQTGAITLVVSLVSPYLYGLPPFIVVWAVYMLTSILTELVSNNAVAVVMTPAAIALAEALGVDARPLVIAVMVAASASFATPIGYQTNTLVYSAGGYRFTDFMKVGIPLNVLIGLLSSFLIPIFWPL